MNKSVQILDADKVREVLAVYAESEITCDGVLSEACWNKARWVELDSSRPRKARNQQEREAWMALTLMNYPEAFFAMKSRAAVLWNSRGLYFALQTEDKDIQATQKTGDWLWLEDVQEIFLAPERVAGAPHTEFQISANNSYLFAPTYAEDNSEEKKISENDFYKAVKSGVKVDGTLNDSAREDKGWCAEVFLSWELLQSMGIYPSHAKADFSVPTTIGAIRFASWDLTIYEQIRLNRHTGPGKTNPHHPEEYRLLICLPVTVD